MPDGPRTKPRMPEPVAAVLAGAIILLGMVGAVLLVFFIILALF